MGLSFNFRALALVPLVTASLVVAMAGPAEAAVFRVTTFNDELNSDNDCSLREALASISEDSGQSGCPDPGNNSNTILLKKGVYKIEREPISGEDFRGDFDLTSTFITIRGRGSRKTFLDGNQVSRVLRIGAESVISDLTVRNGKVTGPGSSLETNGGGIISSAFTVLKRVRVVHNEASGPSEFNETGGGIQSGDQLKIIDSEIAFNHAMRGGGISSNSPLTIENSTIHHNTSIASDGGAGIQVFDETNMTNVTISNNTTDEGSSGGGLAIGPGGDVELNHGTIARNEPGNVTLTDATSFMEMINSVIGGPIAGPNCAEGSGTISQRGRNIDEGDTCLQGAGLDLDPRLRSLGDYGGPVPTMAIRPVSPVRDGSIRGCLDTDARGAPRPRTDCNAAGGNAQDLGAYEFVRCSTRVVNVVGSPRGETLRGSNGSDGILALGGADKVLSGEGNDKACGGGGPDTLKGEGGRDKLLGQAGDDSLNGGAARDACVGGPGNDTATNCEVRKGL